MDNVEPDAFEPLVEIPKLFYSFLEDGPFPTCTMCATDLLHQPVRYFIEKAFRKDEVIFEVAICADCHEKVRQELSRESLAFIEGYLMNQVDFDARRVKLSQTEAEFSDWISHCLVTEKPAQSLDHYQVCAMFVGDRMVLSDMPFLLSGEILQDMQEHLSKKTRDTFDRFTENHLGIGPQVKDLDLVLL